MSRFAVTAVPTLIDMGRHCIEKALAGLDVSSFFLVDATCGNGHDTLFLAQTLENSGRSGHVLALDIQAAALEHARKRLEEAGLGDRVDFVLKGHQYLAGLLSPEEKVAAAMFNLGYLPGSDKQVVTRAESTLAALEALAGVMAKGGIISVHVYTGHSGGEEEGRLVEAWFNGLSQNDWLVGRYSICNKSKNHEVLFLAEKR